MPASFTAPGHDASAAHLPASVANVAAGHSWPLSCVPASSAPWHVPLTWHHPHPGRAAHVAHVLAVSHSSRHSPTLSVVAEHVDSADAGKHVPPPSEHHSHCSSPPHDPHESRDAQ